MTRLHVRNLAVLDEVEVDLAGGFTVLTGETGAGKSMLVDALVLALGGRADSDAVRAGTDRAEVIAVFDVGACAGARAWLAERDLDAGEECQVRRIVTAEGRSRGYVNGQQVPMETLREIGSQLVEICGQHAHQSLLQRAAQRDLVDAHGSHSALLAEMAAAFDAWSAMEAEHRALVAGRDSRRDRRELVGYQVNELVALGVQEGETEALEQEHLLLANAGRIAEGLRATLERLHDAETGSAIDVVGAGEREIETLARLDPRLEPAAAALAESLIHLRDAIDGLRLRANSLEHDPARQEAVENRLATIREIARKHRVEPNALPALTLQLEQELAAISIEDDRLDGIDVARRLAQERLGHAARALHEARCRSAESLCDAVTANLHGLGLPDSTFTVNVESQPLAQCSRHGADHVEFLIGTNAGQPPGPLARVASGGELSRLSLALRVAVLADHGVATLIFDEVDAGIGGGVAEMVGQCLHRLGLRRQVLCVTHLAQVASLADHHHAVTKETRDGETRTVVETVKGKRQVEEIARMLGGIRITARTRDHAREMLDRGRPRRAG